MSGRVHLPAPNKLRLIEGVLALRNEAFEIADCAAMFGDETAPAWLELQVDLQHVLREVLSASGDPTPAPTREAP